MKKFSIFVLVSTLTFISLVRASIPNNDHPKTFLGPILKGSVTHDLSDSTAFSFLGELGGKNVRLGGTLGWGITAAQRFKVSGEYLWQKINYPFFDGDTRQWMQQGAVGADYQYDFDNSNLMPQFEMNAYYSHAPTKNLNTDIGTFVNSVGILQTFTDQKRIAGSNAIGISPGISIQPWHGTKTGIDANYDTVRYNTKFISDHDAKGLGGTVHIKQLLTDNVELGLVAAIRRPYNNYQADLAFTSIPYYGTLVLDVDGAYTAGKRTLPSTYNMGLSVNYFIDQLPETENSSRLLSDTFLGWIAKPAVYMPQVLAIPDEKVSFCTVPILVGNIPNPLTFLFTAFTFNAAPYFSGDNLTYSLTPAQTPVVGSLSINPATGVITGSGLSAGYSNNITITATNSCGSISATTFLNVEV